MAAGRYVILGLASPRSAWFRSVSQWCNSAAIPAEFVKCMSADELRTRLTGDRPFSAALLDGGLPSVDRDLVATAVAAGCCVVVIDDGRVPRNWRQLGAAVVLPAALERAALLDALASHARLVTRADPSARAPGPTAPAASPWKGTVVTVVGPGGTGASTLAIAAAQGLAGDVRFGGSVLLADLCRHAEQAMLHDTGHVAPGLQELVEAHRGGELAAADVRTLTFNVPNRGYDVLLGLRRARFWPSLRPSAFSAAFTTLTRSYQAVVIDADADVEGEAEGGSLDVEERNLAARTSLTEADAVLVVGHCSMKGLHSLTRLLAEVGELGVPASRVVPVLNQSPRSARVRATYAAALVDLTPWRDEQATLAGAAGAPAVVFVPERPVDSILREGTRMPDALVHPLLGALRAVLRPNQAEVARPRRTWSRVLPGSLGHWGDAGIEGAEPEVAG